MAAAALLLFWFQLAPLFLLRTPTTYRSNNLFMTDRPENERPAKVPRSEKQPGAEKSTKTLNFVEFYCGVGGWSMALEAALAEIKPKDTTLKCVAALDHSDLCTKVYNHNHNHQHATTKNIEKVTLQQVQNWHAAIWAMSPPCQPHTRQHDHQEADLDDPRSKSFLHLCDLLDTLPPPSLPRLILVENVVGFETSNSCQRFRQVLASKQYAVAHFHINPTQVGIPNDRPRYYCVAALVQSTEDELLNKYLQVEQPTATSAMDDCKIHPQLEELKIHPFQKSTDDNTNTPPSLASFLDLDPNHPNLDLRIPPKVLESNAAWCFDIVTPQDHRSSCFTSAYGKYVRGTGSVLYFGEGGAQFQLVPPSQREFQKDWAQGLDLKHGLRYLAGAELARLLDFPDTFGFPPEVTRKQQWKLLGNSLNVRVAARLCELGLRVIL